MKKFIYLLLVIAVPLFLASCGGTGSGDSDDNDNGNGGSEVAGVIDDMCDCYKDAGVEKMEDLANLDEDQMTAFDECMKEISKKGEALEEGLSDEEKEELRKEAEAAMKASDCKDLFGYGEEAEEAEFNCEELIADYEAVIAEANALPEDATEDDKIALLIKFQEIGGEMNDWYVEIDKDEECMKKLEALDEKFVELRDAGTFE